MTASQNTDLFDRSCMPRGVGRLLTGPVSPLSVAQARRTLVPPPCMPFIV